MHIADRVITAEVIGRSHTGETELHVDRRAVLTPSAWDYVHEHGIDVVRQGTSAGPVPPAGQPAPEPADVKEVPPAVAEDTRIVQEGRCDHPDKSCGCQSDEFGSGFVEPECCDGCSVERARQEDAGGASCDGCNQDPSTRQSQSARAPVHDIETLVQQITDKVMARLREAG